MLFINQSILGCLTLNVIYALGKGGRKSQGHKESSKAKLHFVGWMNQILVDDLCEGPDGR